MEEQKQRDLEKQKNAKKKTKAKLINNQITTIEELKNLSFEDFQDNEINTQTITTPFVAPKAKLTKQEIEQLRKAWEKKQAKKLLKFNITALEKEVKELEETKQLMEGIQAADKAIRQRVFSHIFNNLTDISQVTGGDTFLNSIVSDDDNHHNNKLTITEIQAQREKLEAKLSEHKDNNQSLDKIKEELVPKEQALLDLKKELLTDEEVFEQWQKQGFTLLQAQEWANTLKNSFNPESDALFCSWLRDTKQLSFEQVKDDNILALRTEWTTELTEQKEAWTNINTNFAKVNWKGKILYQAWIEKGLTTEDAQAWKGVKWYAYTYELIIYLKQQGITPQEYAAFTSKDVQEWLAHFYPVDQRATITALDINGLDLTGTLNLTDFSNLVDLACEGNKLTNLDVSNCSRLLFLNCGANNLTNLNVSNNSALKILFCHNNKSLTKLDVSNNSKLVKLDCSDCNLTTLDLSNNQQLERLYCYSNNFATSDLTTFSQLTNLKRLIIGNWEKDKINQNIYNRFTGSLQPLQLLINLEGLNIKNTDINDGLEYLPDSLTAFYCNANLRPTSLVAELEQALKVYGEPDRNDFISLLKQWKEAHQEVVQAVNQQANIQIPPKN